MIERVKLEARLDELKAHQERQADARGMRIDARIADLEAQLARTEGRDG